jgi:hypothetical protein
MTADGFARTILTDQGEANAPALAAAAASRSNSGFQNLVRRTSVA